jgi:hypothetical protein
MEFLFALQLVGILLLLNAFAYSTLRSRLGRFRSSARRDPTVERDRDSTPRALHGDPFSGTPVGRAESEIHVTAGSATVRSFDRPRTPMQNLVRPLTPRGGRTLARPPRTLEQRS